MTEVVSLRPAGDCPKCGHPDPAFGPPEYREETYERMEYLAWPCVGCGYETTTPTLEVWKADHADAN